MQRLKAGRNFCWNIRPSFLPFSVIGWFRKRWFFIRQNFWICCGKLIFFFLFVPLMRYLIEWRNCSLFDFSCNPRTFLLRTAEVNVENRAGNFFESQTRFSEASARFRMHLTRHLIFPLFFVLSADSACAFLWSVHRGFFRVQFALRFVSRIRSRIHELFVLACELACK